MSKLEYCFWGLDFVISGVSYFAGGPYAVALCFFIGGVLILIGFFKRDESENRRETVSVLFDSTNRPYQPTRRMREWHKWGAVAFGLCVVILISYGVIRRSFHSQGNPDAPKLTPGTAPETHVVEDSTTAVKGKVNPPLVFGFFTLDKRIFPLTEQSLPVVNRGVAIDFFVRNTSDGIAAMLGNITVRIPEGAVYVEEPNGFKKVPDAPDTDREMHFDILNAHEFLHKMTIKFSVLREWSFVKVGLKYACQNCGAVDTWQSLKANLTRGSVTPPAHSGNKQSKIEVTNVNFQNIVPDRGLAVTIWWVNQGTVDAFGLKHSVSVRVENKVIPDEDINRWLAGLKAFANKDLGPATSEEPLGHPHFNTWFVPDIKSDEDLKAVLRGDRLIYLAVLLRYGDQVEGQITKRETAYCGFWTGNLQVRHVCSDNNYAGRPFD